MGQKNASHPITILMKRRPSPSQQLSYLLCPGYIPEKGDSQDAERGTALHRAAELERPRLIDDPNDRQLVELCLEHRDMHLQNLVNRDRRWRTGDAMQLRRYKEKKLPPPPDSAESGGTLDFIALPPVGPYKVAAVIDYKFGYKPVVPVADNPQMIAYAMRVFARYKQIEEVDVSVLIPALRAASHHSFTREEAGRKYYALQANVDITMATSEDPRTYHPGAACTFCARKSQGCEALRLPFLQTVAEENNLPGIPAGEWDLTAADENGLAVYRIMAALMEEFAKATKKAVDEEVDARQMDTLPGYRRITRRDHWVVRDPADAIIAAMGWNPSEGHQLSDLARIVFDETTIKTDKFFDRAVKFLNLMVFTTPIERGTPEEIWKDSIPNPSIFQGFLEKKAGATYLAKAPRRGYVDMLEDVVEYETLQNMSTADDRPEDCPYLDTEPN